MYDATIKIIIVGDPGCGKNTLVQRFLTNLFVSDSKYTIGVNFEVKSLIVDGQRVKLQIWAFEGHERFRFLLPTYFRGARGGIFMYDITNYSSIAHIDDWLKVIKQEIRAEDVFPIIVVGGKADLAENREVPASEGIMIAKSRGVDAFIECSSKTGENVEEAFEALTRLMLNSPEPRELGIRLAITDTIDLEQDHEFQKLIGDTIGLGAAHPASPVTLRGAIMSELKHLFGRDKNRKQGVSRPLPSIPSPPPPPPQRNISQYLYIYLMQRIDFQKELKRISKIPLLTKRLERLRIRLPKNNNILLHKIENAIKEVERREIHGQNEPGPIIDILDNLLFSINNPYNKYIYHKVFLDKFLELSELKFKDNKWILQRVEEFEGNMFPVTPFPYNFRPPDPPDDLDGTVQVQILETPEQSEITRFCKHCGAPLDEGVSVCPNCKKKN